MRPSLALLATLTLPCLAACTMANPLFDYYEISGDETGLDEGLGDEAGPDSDDGPGASGGNANEDAGGEDAAESEGLACEPELGEALAPMFGDPVLLSEVCQPYIDVQVKVFAKQSGQWMAGACPSGDCSDCDPDDLHPLGIVGLPLEEILPAPLPTEDDVAVACYEVEAAHPAGKSDACYYETVAIWEAGEDYEPPLVLAVRDASELGPKAAASLEEWWPEVAVEGEPCGCDALAGMPCCPDEDGVQTFAFDLSEAGGAVVGPMDPPATIELDGYDYTFVPAQAQAGVSCGVDELSWAIFREPSY